MGFEWARTRTGVTDVSNKRVRQLLDGPSVGLFTVVKHS